MADVKAVGGGAIFGLVADSTNPADLSRVFEVADRDLGALHVLINNAALAAGSILDSEYEEWRQVIDTNLLGYMAASRHASDRFLKAGSGHLVNIGSMSAEARDAGSDVYIATKSAIRGFTSSLSKQLNEKGIHVTLIEPVLVGSDMTEGKVSKYEQSKAEEQQKILKAEELAHSVLYVLEQPERCNVAHVQIRPTGQII